MVQQREEGGVASDKFTTIPLAFYLDLFITFIYIKIIIS